jgi:hypothetical protein
MDDEDRQSLRALRFKLHTAKQPCVDRSNHTYNLETNLGARGVRRLQHCVSRVAVSEVPRHRAIAAGAILKPFTALCHTSLVIFQNYQADKNGLNSRVKLILDVDETLTGGALECARAALTKH